MRTGPSRLRTVNSYQLEKACIMEYSYLKMIPLVLVPLLPAGPPLGTLQFLLPLVIAAVSALLWAKIGTQQQGPEITGVFQSSLKWP